MRRRLRGVRVVEIQPYSIEVGPLLADDGAEAVELMKLWPPRLVFLDVRMPKMNGFDVCEIRKVDPELEGTHASLLPARGQEYDRKRGEAARGHSNMTNPSGPDELLAVACRVLGADL